MIKQKESVFRDVTLPATRVTSSEKMQVKNRAAELGLSVSDYIRKCLNDDLESASDGLQAANN